MPSSEGPDHDNGESGSGSSSWDRAVGGDMNAVYGALLRPEDREKASRLEHLDEVEEWQLLMVS